jgi:GNAT superfamily N-acetyltransferase
VTIRLLEADDSLADLTDMIHRAYSALGDMGFNYTAVDQPVSVTRERVAEGECWVAEDEGRIVGTCMLSFPFPTFDNDYFSVDGHAYINQFAVEPELQGRGIGGFSTESSNEREKKARRILAWILRMAPNTSSTSIGSEGTRSSMRSTMAARATSPSSCRSRSNRLLLLWAPRLPLAAIEAANRPGPTS